MHRHMIFFAAGDCPCGGQSGNAVAVCPPQGALIADQRYFTLLTAPKGQALVIPKGANTQAFLKLADGFTGFIWYEAGEIAGTAAPVLTLPLLNPAVSNSYPNPAGFKYLMAGTGDPAAWRMLAAPTAGTYVLQSQNGSFILVDAGSIPGINAIGNSSTTTTKGGLAMLVETSDDVWTLRRLAVVDKRVVVGFVDGDTGETGFKTLPPGSALEHPIGKFQALQFSTLETLDSNGNLISGGIEQAVSYGTGAITDGVRMIYSPGAKRLFRAPAGTLATTNVSTNSASTAVPSTYTLMPGGHGAGVSKTYNYANVRIDFHAVISTNGNTTWMGVFRDGALIQEFNFDVVSVVALACVDEACPPGVHTYDVRWKKTAGSDAVVIGNSYLIVQAMP